MKKLYQIFLLLITLTLVFQPLAAQVDYATQIQPIFTARCTGCHGTSGSVTLTSYDNVLNSAGSSCTPQFIVEPTNAVASSLVIKIDPSLPLAPTCGGGNMPLAGGPLTGAQITLIRQWIDEGAAPADPGGVTYYNTFVQPVLTTNCAQCHNTNFAQANVRLDNMANVLASASSGPGTCNSKTVLNGNANGSPLITAISLDPAIPACAGNKMPPPNGGVVTNAQVNAIAQWINNLITLPVELVHFDAQYNADAHEVDIHWEVPQEPQGDVFTIERTLDGLTYEAIGLVESNLASYPTLQYAWTDQNPVPGKVYYRLKQTDVNGADIYSSVVEVFVPVALQAINLFPNPATDKVNLEIFANAEDVMHIEITGLMGRKVYRESMRIQAGTNLKTVETANWPAGIYLVRIFSAGALNRTMKLMIE